MHWWPRGRHKTGRWPAGPLREILDAWKKQTEVTAGCWIFQAGFTRKKNHPDTPLDAAGLTPLSPANILRDVVLPALEKEEIEWLGYRSFRRGLATNLRALGVDDLTIMEILRHNEVEVTRRSISSVSAQRASKRRNGSKPNSASLSKVSRRARLGSRMQLFLSAWRDNARVRG
jgi:hypothetical protein